MGLLKTWFIKTVLKDMRGANPNSVRALEMARQARHEAAVSARDDPTPPTAPTVAAPSPREEQIPMEPNAIRDFFALMREFKSYENEILKGHMERERAMRDLIAESMPEEEERGGDMTDTILAAVLPRMLAPGGASGSLGPGQHPPQTFAAPAPSATPSFDAGAAALALESQMPAGVAAAIRKGKISRGDCLNFLYAYNIPRENADAIYEAFIGLESADDIMREGDKVRKRREKREKQTGLLDGSDAPSS